MSRVVRIECPQCRGTIEINLETGKVIRHWAAKPDKAAAPADFAALAEEVRRRAQQGLPDIDKALEEQQRRRDEEFERAKRRALGEDPEKNS
jgi:hypothetical protein